MEAVVLAGGLGTRLRPVVADLPKPMAAVGGRPFLEILLRRLEAGGVRRAILSVGYLRERIIEHFGDRLGSLRIDYAVEDRPLGTGGALRRGLEMVEGERAVACNGDTYVETDLAGLWRSHESARRGDPSVRLSLAVQHVPDARRYGRVRVEKGRVVGFEPAGAPGPAWINAGLYVVERELLASDALPEHFSFERDFLETRIDRVRAVAYETRGLFIDIGVPEDYRRADQLLGVGAGLQGS